MELEHFHMNTTRLGSNTKHLKKIGEWKGWEKYSKAEWFVLAVGSFSILVAFVALFTSLQERTPPPTATAEIVLSDQTQFEQTLASTINAPVQESSPITILTNGAEFVPDLLTEIEAATEYVHITNYIWDDGEFGKMLFEALIQKAHEGVQVRVLLDGVGGRSADEDYIEELRNAGGRVAHFRPVSWWSITRAHKRTHIRGFIFDGKVAYTGGLAIADAWLGDATETDSWHDFMFKVSGNMAREEEKMFANLWSLTTGEIVVGDSGNPSRELAEEETTGAGGRFISLFSAPSPDLYANMEHFLWISLRAAEKSIHIENPYLVPSKELLALLEVKARAGVDVVLILPSHTDAKSVQWATRSFYSSLLESGVRIFEYQPARLHAKTIIVDGTWSIIGSANLDNRSSQLNLEMITGVYDPVFGAALLEKFEEDLKVSEEITLSAWKPRSTFWGPIGFLSRAFIKQY